MQTTTLFRNRFVQSILLAGLFAQIGIWVRNFSILLYVMEITKGDSFAVSMISVAEFGPIFLFSFLGGALADRWRPKNTMIWCDILSAISIFLVLPALLLGGWRAVFLALLFSATLSQFSQPAGMKLFKIHVPNEHLQAGMSLYQTMFAIFMILGPILGTFVYQSFGIQISIVVMGAAFLLSALSLLLLPRDVESQKEKTESTLRQDMTAGIRYVLSKRILTLLGVCFLLAGLAVGLIQPLGIFLVTERLELPKEYLQWLLTASGIGMILGGGLAMAVSKKIKPAMMLVLGMSLSTICTVCIVLTKELWLILPIQLLNGLFLPFIQIGINTMILQNTESEVVGRVNGILTPLFTGAMVLTMSLSGMLKQLWFLEVLYYLSALLFLAGVLVIVPLTRSSTTQSKQEAQATSTN
ncbi:MFS transporter [Risungbinella massiliensis]|uniref:MFS transporter n=1 Tax=Risungbinella massiliensis TaxID=1329796 RepID=UPI0005CB926A|nr:MFS transporter [Risungbinella massiliensis]